MNGTLGAGDQLIWTVGPAREAMMGNAMINALIAAGVVSAIGYGWITHLQNRGQRRSRAGAGGDGSSSGDTYSGSNNGFSLGSWFSSDSSGSPADGGSCSSSDSGSSGGDCGGGGDGGGGGGGD
ncbi:hypothetical protein GGD65_001894 [Bradyrhizobium sp. CIR18]|nr:hypothetical protein [Bradyrhizobium sp. CIR3A]MBB4360872.1 hypothetical protein [Bradyrhizobium sp. CIR18]MBB4395387.1 hypothetical protein [Bradyrhizobium sp. ERR14]NYG47499.1 hypothetical protein [Bradyrhizobium sp. IAR9]